MGQYSIDNNNSTPVQINNIQSLWLNNNVKIIIIVFHSLLTIIIVNY